jgi:PAS domain-containing protein
MTPPDPEVVLSQLPVGVVLRDRNGFVTYSNAASCQLLGSPDARTATLPQAITDLANSVRSSPTSCSRSVVVDQRTLLVTCALLDVSKSPSTLFSTASKANSGVVMITLTEVTPLLSQYSAILDLVEQSRAPVFTTDPGGRVTTWNEGAAQITGFSRADMVGRSISTAPMSPMFAAEQHVQVDQQYRDPRNKAGGTHGGGCLVRALLDRSPGEEGHISHSCEVEITTKKGAQVNVLLSMTAKAQGSPCLLGVFQDISSLRSDISLLAEYAQISGLAAWRYDRGNVDTRAIENMIARHANMDKADPRLVVWRVSFISILQKMCGQELQEDGEQQIPQVRVSYFHFLPTPPPTQARVNTPAQSASPTRTSS